MFYNWNFNIEIMDKELSKNAENASSANLTAVEWLVKELNLEGYDYTVKQAKEMEKEQMIKFAEFVATYSDKNKNVNGEMLHAKSKYDGAERTVDLLLTYKSEQ
jgi:L-lactate utilization protein LutB